MVMKRFVATMMVCIGLLLLGTTSAFCMLIDSGIVTLDGTESILSKDRVLRDGVASTWAASKSYPGTINGSTNYYFETVNVTPGSYEYVRVSYEFYKNEALNIFMVGYLNSFNVNGLSTNYLGDPGSSIIVSEPGPKSFEVFVPNGDSLVLVFNTCYENTFGTVSYKVEGFTSEPVPEPCTMLLIGLGLVGLAGFKRRMK